MVNTSWEGDWIQWGFDHFPPIELGEYDYYYYRRYTKERPRKTADQYLGMLNRVPSKEAKKALKHYNMIKGAHASFYKNVKEEEERLLEIQLEEQKKQNEIKKQEEERLLEIKKQEEKILLEIKKQEEKILDSKKQEEKTLSDLLIQSDELESFYEFDPITENKEIIESITVPAIENKEIPLETVTPVLVVLGIGLVSYYLLKGNKK
tara:strand:- start:184 stop:804 length:621 start_codon:yes stop_codon:yes gene_type:complete